MENERIRRIYDVQGASLGGPLDRRLLGGLRRRALREASGRVLEIGVGSGASLGFYPPGCELVGVDLSPVSLAHARRRAEKLGLPASFLEADAQALPFEDASFDTCTSQLVLCTVPDPLATLRELRRVCRPGGRVLLLEHTTSTNPLLKPLCYGVAPLLTRAENCHPNRPVEQLVRDAGLQLESVERRAAGVFRLLRARP